MKKLITRILLIIPWFGLFWFISKGMQGDFNLLLVFLSLFILIPLTVAVNLFTVVMIQGKDMLKIMKQAQKQRGPGQKPLKSTNYADLPWWNPKKYQK